MIRIYQMHLTDVGARELKQFQGLRDLQVAATTESYIALRALVVLLVINGCIAMRALCAELS